MHSSSGSGSSSSSSSSGSTSMVQGQPSANDSQRTVFDKYRKVEQVGEGTFGVVYKAVDRNTGEVVALKKTRLDPCSSNEEREERKQKKQREKQRAAAIAARKAKKLASQKKQQQQRQGSSSSSDELLDDEDEEAGAESQAANANEDDDDDDDEELEDDGKDEGVPATAIREIAVLRELKHANIVSLKDVMYSNRTIYLVFEYLRCDLKKYVDEIWKRKSKLKPMAIKSFVYQMLQGLSYCHARRVLHRDLKPANLLLDDRGTLKLADFGLARTFGLPMRTLTHEVVTLWYRAPEILLGTKRYSPAVDLWSVGCIFAELVRGHALFPKSTELEVLFAMFEAFGTPSEAMWPGVSELRDFKATFPKWPGRAMEELVPGLEPAGVDLLRGLLRYDASKRLSAKAAQRHEYFDDLKALHHKMKPEL